MLFSQRSHVVNATRTSPHSRPRRIRLAIEASWLTWRSESGSSHAENIRVHMPDGSFTDGLDAHVAALQALFAWAPDTSISEHPIRVAKNDLTAVTGVMRGTFTQPMQLPNGTVPPTGKRFAINMATVGMWNARGVMDEEWLFWDNLSFFQQIGLA